jgi:hypothetical protein
MSITRRKVRLVTFRLSAEEYQLLFETSMATGSRSVSDFTRNAVIRQSKLSAAPRGLLSDDLATIGRELYELDGELRRLCDRIQRVMGTEEQVTAAESRQPAYSFKAQSSS